MSADNLITSIFDKVIDEKRNNTPILDNEETELLSESIDIELSTVEDNKDSANNNVDPIADIETKISEIEEMIRDEPSVDKKETSKYVILCASIRKLFCYK